MIEVVGTKQLRTGELIRISRITLPVENDLSLRIDKLIDFFGEAYLNSPWKPNTLRILSGKFVNVSNDVFIVAELKDSLVGLVWYATALEDRRISTFGRVITDPNHRRKGIARILSEIAFNDFVKNGGRVMYLNSKHGFVNSEYAMYRDLSFQDYNYIENVGTIMRRSVAERLEEFESKYFEQTDEVKLRSPRWGDLARCEALYNFPAGVIKDRALQVYSRTPYETQFLLMMEVFEGGMPCLLMESPNGAVLGLARLSKNSFDGNYQSHLLLLDFFIHPRHYNQGERLIGKLLYSIDKKEKKIECYVAEKTEEIKAEVLQRIGFKKETTLEDYLRYDGEKTGVSIYTLV